MSKTQFKIWEAIRAIGRGVWFSQSVIAERAGVSSQTARKHLMAMSETDELRRQETLYNNHIRQSLYMWGE